MFDFRYHAVSLVAVLVALVVGLLLGVAIGDAGLVSSAEKQIRNGLKGDVRRANDRAEALRGKLDEQQRYADAAYPLLVAGRLPGVKVGLVFLGRPSEAIADDVRAALRDTQGRLTGTLALREPVDLAALAGAAGATRYTTIDRDSSLLQPFGERIGHQLVEPPGKLLRDESRALFGTRSGSSGPYDAVIIYRNQPKLTGDGESQTNAIEDGIVAGLRATIAPTVGVQRTSTDPSQITWYRDRDLTSVDNADQQAGHAALVFALAGAEGTFGVGGSAESVLPGPESLSG